MEASDLPLVGPDERAVLDDELAADVEPVDTVGPREDESVDGISGAADPVDGLVFSGPHRVDRLYVGGELVVEDGALVRADEREIARLHRVQARRFSA